MFPVRSRGNNISANNLGATVLKPLSYVSVACPSVMASGVTGSVSVALHPLVILNISDHWIRIRSQEGRPMQGTYDEALQDR